MAFHDVRLPVCIERGAQGGPQFLNSVFQASSGYESRQEEWQNARGRWDISYGVRNKSDMENVLAFFYARRGKANTFRFKDWSDYKIGDDDTDDWVQMGTGTGSQTEFPIYKRYSSGSTDFDRRIYRPIESTVRIFVSGVEQTLTTDYTLDATTGTVTFNSAPANGFSVGIICEFDVPVRFDTDSLDYNTQRSDLFGVPDIPIVEVRETYTSESAIAEGPWSISLYSRDGYTFNGTVPSADGVRVKPDGTVWLVVSDSFDRLGTMSMSTPWQPSSSSETDRLDSISGGGGSHDIKGFDVKPDGTKCYVVDRGSSSIYQVTLNTPWSGAGGRSVDKSASTAANGRSSYSGLKFNEDGTAYMIAAYGGDVVQKWVLSSAWDIATASFSQEFSVASETTKPRDLYINPEGTKLMIASDTSPQRIIQYDLATGWDLDTASYNGVYFEVSDSQNIGAVDIGNSGTMIFYASSGSPYKLYRHNLA